MNGIIIDIWVLLWTLPNIRWTGDICWYRPSRRHFVLVL